MRDDLDYTFGEIFDESPSKMMSQLVKMQTLTTNRKRPLQWLDRQKFIDISRMPLLGSKTSQRGLPLRTITLPIIVVDTEEWPRYLAVSYAWKLDDMEPPAGCKVDRHFEYKIKRPGQTAHKSGFPDQLMDRVIKVAQSRDLTKIWIDKECIYQRRGDDRRDQELGVQVMDHIYEGAELAVGLLTTWIRSQEEVDVLSLLLNNKFVECGELVSGMDQSLLRRLIKRLIRDRRWDRAWIFHEDHLAGSEMALLIPCPGSKSVRDEALLGCVSNELLIPLPNFKGCITSFYCAPRRDTWSEADAVLHKLKRYKVFNDLKHSSERTTTVSVVKDICSRGVTYSEDRLPILANAVRFDDRLDTSKSSCLVKDNSYSLSIALLVTILTNGEVLLDKGRDKSQGIMSYTLRSYLSSCEISLGSSDRGNNQYFLDHQRLGRSKITAEGVMTTGWIFKVERNTSDVRNTFRLDEDERRKIMSTKGIESDENGDLICKTKYARNHVARSLCSRLETYWGDCELVAMLHQYLAEERLHDLSRPLNCLTSLFSHNMSTVVQAYLKGRTILTARLLRHDREDGPPSGLIIDPIHDGKGNLIDFSDNVGPDNMLLFMSWKTSRPKTNRRRIDCCPQEVQAVTSMQVEAFDTRKGLKTDSPKLGEHGLRVCGWIDGVWDVRGTRMENSLLLLPGMPMSEASRKRKRGY